MTKIRGKVIAAILTMIIGTSFLINYYRFSNNDYNYSKTKASRIKEKADYGECLMMAVDQFDFDYLLVLQDDAVADKHALQNILTVMQNRLGHPIDDTEDYETCCKLIWKFWAWSYALRLIFPDFNDRCYKEESWLMVKFFYPAFYWGFEYNIESLADLLSMTTIVTWVTLALLHFLERKIMKKRTALIGKRDLKKYLINWPITFFKF